MSRSALAAVFTAAFLGFFEVSAIYVIAPSIQDELGAGYSTMQWVIGGYTLPFALLVVTGGRLGDIWGIRRVFLLGTACFAAASLVAGLSSEAAVLVAARAFQGCSAALMMPQVLSALRVGVPEQRRGAAFAGYAAVVSVATVCGPLLGGLLLQTGPGWRLVFLSNVPLALLALVLGSLYLADSRSEHPAVIDPFGVLLSAVGMFLLLYPVIYRPSWSWVLLLGSAAVLALFGLRQLRTERAGVPPLVALGLFTRPAFTAGLLINTVVAWIMGAYFFVFAIVLQDGFAFSGPQVGLTMVPWAVGTALAAFASVRLTRRLGRGALLLGALVMAVGLAVLAGSSDTTATSPLPVAAGLLLAGTGMGLVSTPVIEVTMASVPRRDAGNASGVLTTFRQIGSTFGVAAGGTLFFTALGTTEGATQAEFAAAYGTSIYLNIGLCLVMAVAVFLLPRTAGRSEGAPPTASRPKPAGRTNTAGPGEADEPLPVALLLPGQGAQHPRMGAGLYGWDPVVTDTMDRAFQLLEDEGERLRADWLAERPSELFDDVTRAQPLLYALDCAIGRAILSRNVRPAALLGHSVGEMAAATLAGVLDFDDGIRLIRNRVEVFAAAPAGGMLAVAAPAEELTPYLRAGVAVGAVNGPRQTLLAGPAAPLDAVRTRLTADGHTCRMARARQPFHSPVLAADAARSEPAWRSAPLRTPRLTIYSCYRAAPLTAEAACDPAYWVPQPAQPVLFGPALDRMLADLDLLLIEAGPGQGLTALAKRHPAVLDGSSAAVAALPARQGEAARDRASLQGVIDRLRAEGHDPPPSAIDENGGEPCPTPRSPTK